MIGYRFYEAVVDITEKRKHGMKISNLLRERDKVIGYFAYVNEDVFCDGDACIIAGSENQMKSYLNRVPNGGQYLIKKTRFGEIIKGLNFQGSYAFDKEAYNRFFQIAEINRIELPVNNIFLDAESTETHFIRIQFFS